MTRFKIITAWLLGCCFIGCRGSDPADDETPDGSGTGASPAGGSGAQPGSGGSGGQSAPQPPVGYGGGALTEAQYGAFPSTVTKADAQSAYDTFRGQYTESCGDEGLRVTIEDGETLSEGMGHGALLAVGWDDRATFDGILTYYQRAVAATDAKKSTPHGLMGWRVWGDYCSLGGIHPGAVSGAELNMAMALLQAECQWGGSAYYYAGLKLMDAIRTHLTVEVPEGTALLPGDEDDVPSCMNASYMAPAYYRVFAKAQPEQAAFWNKMADDAYVFLELAADGSTGLVGDWAPIGASDCTGATTYVGYDGIRTHWRIATDYAWFGTPAAQTWLDKVTGWFNGTIGADKLLDLEEGFFSDGSAILGEPNQADSAFVGAWAVGAIPVGQGLSDSFHQALLAVPAANDDGYYPAAARALYMMLSVNQFSPGCYDEAP